MTNSLVAVGSESSYWYDYLKVTIIYGYIQILGDLKIVDLAGINFSDYAITCSINSKMRDKF